MTGKPVVGKTRREILARQTRAERLNKRRIVQRALTDDRIVDELVATTPWIADLKAVAS